MRHSKVTGYKIKSCHNGTITLCTRQKGTVNRILLKVRVCSILSSFVSFPFAITIFIVAV